MTGLIGIILASIVGPDKAGLVLSGRFRDPRAPTGLNFGTNTVTISGCGKLVPEGRGYSITKGPNSLVVTVYNEPRPLVLTTRPDGGVLGRGLVDVKGSVISGSHTETRTLYANGLPVADSSCGGVCSQRVTGTGYAPKIERPAIGCPKSPPPLAPPGAHRGVRPALVPAPRRRRHHRGSTTP